MTQDSPEIWLVRHGETAWSLSGQHTSRTDLGLTPSGEAKAAALGRLLHHPNFQFVASSPMLRALETCRMSGLAPQEVWEELREWDYGDYEGLTTPQIRESNPDWSIWAGEVPNGESRDDVQARADMVLRRLSELPGPQAVFSHGHFLRVLASRWIGLEASEGRLFALDTGSISILGYERTTRVMRSWNRLVP